MTDIKQGLFLWSTKFLIKRPQAGVLICMQIINMHANNKIKQNQRHLAMQKLQEKLRKPIIQKREKRTVFSGFKDNI